MQSPPDRSAQDAENDLLAPAPEAFADLLARTLADLPTEADAEPHPAPPPRRSLMQRILGRRRPPVEAAPAPVEAPAEVMTEEGDDDVLLLDTVVVDASEPEPEPEPEPVAMEAIPLSLTPASAPLGDSRPGLLERLFGRHPVEPPESPDAALDGDDDGDVMVLDDRFLAPSPPPVLTLPVERPADPPPAPQPPETLPAPQEIVLPPPAAPPEPVPRSAAPPTGFLLQQVFDALARQAAPAPCAPAEDGGAGQRELLQSVLQALAMPAEVAPVAVEPPPVAEIAEREPQPDPEPDPEPDEDGDGDDDTLVLDDSFVFIAVVTVPAEPEPEPEPEPLLLPLPPPTAMTREDMAELIAAATPDGVGTLDLPDRIESLAALLLTPSDDFAAQDLLHECWPRGSTNLTSRALLAVAVNLSRNFGLPGKLPMAASKAWRMLDSQVFQAALAQRLAAIGDFVFAWQRSQFTFLSLEFGEIELIEYLFEALHTSDHVELLAAVMNFKVLSGRRIGLLRRVPGHARRAVEALGPKQPEQALRHLARVRALLIRLGQPDGFPPIIEAAERALIEIEKMMKQLASPPPAAPGEAGRSVGLPLGKI